MNIKEIWTKMTKFFRTRCYGANIGSGKTYLVWADSPEAAVGKLTHKMETDPDYQAWLVRQQQFSPPDDAELVRILGHHMGHSHRLEL